MGVERHHSIFLSVDGPAFNNGSLRIEFIGWLRTQIGRHGKEWDIWDRYNYDGSDSIGRDIWVYTTNHALMLKLTWGGL